MVITIRSVTLLAASLSLVAGCGDAEKTPTPAPAVLPSPESLGEPATPLTGPSTWDVPSDPPAEPTPGAAAAPKRLGAPADAGGGTTVIAFGYRQPVATTAPPPARPGYEWGAADVQACLAGDAGQAVTVSSAPWKLSYESDTRAVPSSRVHLRFPAPRYAFGQQRLIPGGCLRGWITFPAPKDERPTLIEHGTEDGGAYAVWLVS